jgi:hypothetical protein
LNLKVGWVNWNCPVIHALNLYFSLNLSREQIKFIWVLLAFIFYTKIEFSFEKNVKSVYVVALIYNQFSKV